MERNRERITVRGLNHNHNHDLKNLLKGAAISAIERPGPLQDFYAALVEKGIRPRMARLTLARKIAAITLILWKKGATATTRWGGCMNQKRCEFRPQTVAATSSLSISGEEEDPPFEEFPLLVVGRILEMLGSREVSVNEIRPRVP